jgi:hypothetical protein
MTFKYGRDQLIREITKAIGDPEFRARLQLQFGMIEEAATTATEANLRHLMPMIGNYAQNGLKSAVVTKMMKLIGGK